MAKQSELEAHILSFYEQLYTRDEQVEGAIEARTDRFQHLNQPITEAHNKKLFRLITMEEVVTTVKQLPVGKAPGMVPIPTEFYQTMWEYIGCDVFNFVTESIRQCYIADERNISKIAIPPKS